MDSQALGRFLRQSREAKELTLEEAERALRIRQRILESFELGDFNLPELSAIQIRGFVRNYARFLGLEEDRILQYYEAALRGDDKSAARKKGKRRKKDIQPAPIAPRSITDTNPSLPVVNLPLSESRQPRGGILSLLFRLLVGAAALSVIVFVVVQLTRQSDVALQGTPPPANILGQLPPSQTFTPAPTFTAVSLLPTPMPGVDNPAFAGQGVFVVLEATQRTWLRVLTDGVEQYAGIVSPGTQMQIPASQNVTMTASNAEALDIIWNGQQQRSFGGRGQRVDIVFTESNVEISTGPGYQPTSPFTPTPLPTSPVDVSTRIAEQTPSSTPGPSPTPTITLTPSDTPTITLTPSETPTITNTPTETLTPSPTLTPSNTPTITLTPSPTLTPTNTLTPSPTAILPPRIPPANPTPTKAGA